MIRLIHMAANQAHTSVWNKPFLEALASVGHLDIVENGAALSDTQRAARLREADIVMTSWGAARIPEELAEDPGRVRYICHVTGELRWAVPLAVVDAGIPVTNWGDTPANGVAEGAMTLLLAVLKDLHEQILAVREDGWRLEDATHGGTLHNLDVGIYGCGVIGRRFVELLRPFGSVIRVYDPYAEDLPDGCTRVNSLEALFSSSQAIVIHAGLCDETRHSVSADLLARLPRHGIVINTARGGIIDQDALFAELETGRLRAGLDVLEPDNLPEEHPARCWPNLILTAHNIERGWPSDGEPPKSLNLMQEVALDNIRQHLAGKPLRFVMDRDRYLRST